MQIRKARHSDAQAIADFNIQLALETEHLQLNPATVLHGVQRGLQHETDVQYWVMDAVAAVTINPASQEPPLPAGTTTQSSVDSAEVRTPNLIVGQLMLTREWSDWRDGWILWLQSVFVHPEYRGQGVFRSLLQHVLYESRRQTDVRGLRLYVEDKNERACEVYRRLQFSDAGYRVMEQIF